MKIKWSVLLAPFIWGFGLSIVNNGKDSFWKVFESGNPVVCLLLTFLFGLALPGAILGRWVVVGTLLSLLAINFSGLLHLSLLTIAVNLLVQAGFFYYGYTFFERQAWTDHKEVPKLLSPMTDDEEVSRYFKHLEE